MKPMKAIRKEIKRAERKRKRARDVSRGRRRLNYGAAAAQQYYKGYRDGLRYAAGIIAEFPTIHGLTLEVQTIPSPPLSVQKGEWKLAEDEDNDAAKQV